MKTSVYSTEGKVIREMELDDNVFGLPVNEDVIWYAINNELANKRVGTACTKDRGEVHGSNAKPYKQKGTGRARRGDKKSPLLVGGGTIFGPKPRDFSYSIPKKAKRLALKSILSLKAQNDCLTVIEDFTVESGKTRDLAAILAKFGDDVRTVFVLRGEEVDTRNGVDNREEVLPAARKIRQAGRALPRLTFLAHNRLRAHDLFYARRVIMQESAAQKVGEFYAALAQRTAKRRGAGASSGGAVSGAKEGAAK